MTEPDSPVVVHARQRTVIVMSAEEPDRGGRPRLMRWYPVPTAVVVGALMCTGLAAFASTLPQWTWLPPRWSVTSGWFRQSLLVVAPVVMMCSIYVARVRPAIICGRAPGRPYLRIVNRHLVVLLVSISLGYLAGLSPLLVRTALRATSGGPDLWVAAAGLAEVAAWCVTGYAIGAVARFPRSLVMAVALPALLCWLIPALLESFSQRGNQAYYAVLPFWLYGDRPVTWHDASSVSLFRVVLFASWAFGLWRLVTVLDRPVRRHWHPDWFTLVAVTAPLSLLVAGCAVNPAVAWEDTNPPVSCAAGTGGITVCVYSEVGALLPAAKDALQLVVDVGGSAQYTGSVGPAHIGDSFSSRTSLIDLREAMVSGFAGYLVGLSDNARSCMSSGRVDPWGSPEPSPAGLAASAVWSSLVARVVRPEQLTYLSDDTLEGRLAKVSNADLRVWLDEHGEELRACLVTAENLPI